jgi:hypothetical protein
VCSERLHYTDVCRLHSSNSSFSPRSFEHIHMLHSKQSQSPCQWALESRLKCDGTWWRTGGEMKGKLTNGAGSQYSSHYLGHSVSSITTADAHTSAASNWLNWRPSRFKWTRPFRRKKKSGFCACAITFQTQSTKIFVISHRRIFNSKEINKWITILWLNGQVVECWNESDSDLMDE